MRLGRNNSEMPHMKSTPLDDALLDLEDAISAFKASPNTATLDYVYRATTGIELACTNQLKTGA